MVLFGRTVLDAVVGEVVPAICAGKVSAAGETVRAVVREERVCTRGVPQEGFGKSGADSTKAWLRFAAVGGIERKSALLADDVELGC